MPDLCVPLLSLLLLPSSFCGLSVPVVLRKSPLLPTQVLLTFIAFFFFQIFQNHSLTALPIFPVLRHSFLKLTGHSSPLSCSKIFIQPMIPICKTHSYDIGLNQHLLSSSGLPFLCSNFFFPQAPCLSHSLLLLQCLSVFQAIPLHGLCVNSGKTKRLGHIQYLLSQKSQILQRALYLKQACNTKMKHPQDELSIWKYSLSYFIKVSTEHV